MSKGKHVKMSKAFTVKLTDKAERVFDSESMAGPSCKLPCVFPISFQLCLGICASDLPLFCCRSFFCWNHESEMN